MVSIQWHPSRSELRRWSVFVLAGAVVGGCVLHFPFGQLVPARALWTFGALSFVAGMTGTRAALPFYLLWMGFVWVVSQVLGTLALALVFYLVVTPLGIGVRLLGRDRLKLRRPDPAAQSFWEDVPPRRLDRSDRPF